MVNVSNKKLEERAGQELYIFAKRISDLSEQNREKLIAFLAAQENQDSQAHVLSLPVRVHETEAQ